MSKAKKKKAAQKPGQKAATTHASSAVKDVSVAGEVVTDPLSRWNKWLAIALLFEGLAIAVIGTGRGYPVVAHYAAVDPLSKGVAEASRLLFDVRLATLVGFALIVAAMIHFLSSATSLEHYKGLLKRGLQPLRWMERAFAGTILLVCVALAAGVADAALLVALLVLGFATNWLRLLADQTNEGAARPDWRLFAVACMTGAAQWLIVFWYLVSSAVLNGAAGGYVWAAFGVAWIVAMASTMLQFGRLSGKKRWADLVRLERWQLAIGFLAVSVPAWLLFAGVLLP